MLLYNKRAPILILSAYRLVKPREDRKLEVRSKFSRPVYVDLIKRRVLHRDIVTKVFTNRKTAASSYSGIDLAEVAQTWPLDTIKAILEYHESCLFPTIYWLLPKFNLAHFTEMLPQFDLSTLPLGFDESQIKDLFLNRYLEKFLLTIGRSVTFFTCGFNDPIYYLVQEYMNKTEQKQHAISVKHIFSYSFKTMEQAFLQMGIAVAKTVEELKKGGMTL